MRKIQKNIRPLGAIALSVLLLILPVVTTANSPDLWGGLQPGNYDIGFKTIETYDYSRTFRCKHDLRGNPRPGERARPIQICIWYPAQHDDDMAPMVFSEYVFPNPANPDFFELLSRLQEREIYNVLFPLVQNSYVHVNDLLSLNLAAVRDAAPVAGRFPLILYHPDLTNSYCDNAILCEYLASHGFVVATTHSLGTLLPFAETTQRDLESLVRDKEFILAHLRTLPQVDPDHLGLLGNAFGSLTTILTQMRNSDIDAAVTLIGWEDNPEYLELVDGNMYFDPTCVRTPLLHVAIGEGNPTDSSAIHTFHYAPLYLGVMPEATTGDLSIYNTLLSTIPDTANPNQPVGNPRYESTCEYLMQFFRLLLHNDSSVTSQLLAVDDATSDTDILMNRQFTAKIDAPPTEAQFVNAISDEGVTVGAEMYHKYCHHDTSTVFFRRETINALGYQFMRQGDIETAEGIFQLSTEAFPTAAGSWLGLGYSFMYNEQNDSAVVCFQKTLKLLPADSAIAEERKPGLTGYIQRTIERLQQPPDEESN